MLWGINQGGTYADLRIRHMQQIAESWTCRSYAIGGLAVGEHADVYDIIDAVEPYAEGPSLSHGSRHTVEHH